MNDVQRLAGLDVGKDSVVIVRPSSGNWYELLEVSDKLKKAGMSIIVLDRFSSNISVISESRMNEIGWYRHG